MERKGVSPDVREVINLNEAEYDLIGRRLRCLVSLNQIERMYVPKYLVFPFLSKCHLDMALATRQKFEIELQCLRAVRAFGLYSQTITLASVFST